MRVTILGTAKSELNGIMINNHIESMVTGEFKVASP